MKAMQTPFTPLLCKSVKHDQLLGKLRFNGDPAIRLNNNAALSAEVREPPLIKIQSPVHVSPRFNGDPAIRLFSSGAPLDALSQAA
jgi:hypothetical protein